MLSKLLKPNRIVVIGASSNKHKLGNVIYTNILRFGFKGKVFPVNVKGGKIKGTAVTTSVKKIRGNIDLAIIVVPAAIVSEVLRECGEKKIPFAIIISAGFSETDAAGKKREKELIEISRSYNIRLLGPNCLGILTPERKLNASFADGLPLDGHVGVISQSGAMAVAITDWAESTKLGFSSLISLGNKSDISEEELLKYFSKDHKTHVVIMYLESLKGGRSLLRTIQQVSKKTPIVVLLPGKSDEAQHAVASHTGALAGSYEVQQAMLRDAGAVVVQTLEELFLYTKIFENKHVLSNNRVAVITNAGGPGIIATDALMSSGLRMATISKKTQELLQAHLPITASLQNPIDIVGDAPIERFRHALHVIMADDEVDVVLLLLTHQYVTETVKIAVAAIAVQKKYPKTPLIASFVGGNSVKKGREVLHAAGIPHFNFPVQAVKAISALWKRSKAHSSNFTFADVTPMISDDTSHMVLGKQAEKLLRPYVSGIPKSFLIQTKKDLMKKAKRIGYPVAVKVIQAQSIHKTDKGLVRVNILTEKELLFVTKIWLKKITFFKDEGILVQPYLPGKIELFIGAKRDVEFGPHVVFGVGGIFVESLRLTDIAPLPLTKSQANNFIVNGSLGKLFSSRRGKSLPIKKLVLLLVGLSKAFVKNKQILDVDLNPVIVTEKDVHLVDIRVSIQK